MSNEPPSRQEVSSASSYVFLDFKRTISLQITFSERVYSLNGGKTGRVTGIKM